jgi:hypothetical protein
VFQESIFEAPEEGEGDSLFGGPPQPLVEMPPEASIANIQVETTPPPAPHFQVAAAPLPDWAAAPAVSEGLKQEPSAPPGPEEPGSAEVAGLNFSGPQDGGDVPAPAEAPAGEPEAEAGDEALAALTTPPRVQRSARGGMLVPTLLIVLIPYSIVATVAVVLLYLKGQQPSLEVLPDPQPDKDSGGPTRRGADSKQVRHDLNVPAKLLTRLGHAVRIGDLEVVPRRVERLPGNRLRLRLTLRNVSDDLDFNPVSNDFLTHQRGVPAARKPYTFLEVVGTPDRVYGGEWQTTRKGEPFSGRLGPGEQMEGDLTTDPRDARRVRTFKEATAPFLWRIQVRRGFVHYRGQDISATAVVGIEFHFKDIVPARPEEDWARLRAAWAI